jgi:hypothetical protein
MINWYCTLVYPPSIDQVPHSQSSLTNDPKFHVSPYKSLSFTNNDWSCIKYASINKSEIPNISVIKTIVQDNICKFVNIEDTDKVPKKSMQMRLSKILRKDLAHSVASNKESEILNFYENYTDEYGLQGQGQSLAEDKEQNLENTDEYIQIGYNRKDYRTTDKQSSNSINHHSSLIQPLLEVIEEDTYENIKGAPEEFDDMSIDEECVDMFKVPKSNFHYQRSLTRKLPNSKIKSSKFINMDSHVQVVEVYLGSSALGKDSRTVDQFVPNKNKFKKGFMKSSTNPYHINSSSKYYTLPKHKNLNVEPAVKGLENVKSSKYQQL